jgi:hypothetical protein
VNLDDVTLMAAPKRRFVKQSGKEYRISLSQPSIPTIIGQRAAVVASQSVLTGSLAIHFGLNGGFGGAEEEARPHLSCPEWLVPTRSR